MKLTFLSTTSGGRGYCSNKTTGKAAGKATGEAIGGMLINLLEVATDKGTGGIPANVLEGI